jgi:hypothetical protein
MGLYTKLPEELNEVDIIIAGGGCLLRQTQLCNADNEVQEVWQAA